MKKVGVSVISKTSVELVWLVQVPMRRLLLLTVALALCLTTIPRQVRVSSSAARRDPSLFRAGEVIVKFKQGAAALQAHDQKHRAISVASLASESSSIRQDAEPLVNVTTSDRVGEIITQNGLDRVFVLKFDPSLDVESVVHNLAGRDELHADIAPES